MSVPLRSGNVWLVGLDPVISSDQAGQLPAVIVSGPLHLALPHAVVFVTRLRAGIADSVTRSR